MTAVPGLSTLTGVRGHRTQLFAATLMLLCAALAGIAVANWALFFFAGLAAVAVLGFMLCRLDLMVAVLAADFFFNAYISRGAGILTVDKCIGALAAAAWLLDWVVNRRPVIGNGQLWLIGAFLLWTAVALAGAVNEKAALVTALRYLTFAVLFFLVIQSVRGEQRRAEVLIRVLLAAASVASVIGLVAFFTHHVARASGPIRDPNDFGFILASSVPLAIYQVRWVATRWGRAVSCAAVLLILGCTLATFSRSALTGLTLAMLWSLLTGRIRLRWVLTVLVCLVVAVGLALLTSPQLVHDAFGQKTHIAIKNVNVRFGYYHVEVSEWEHYPLTGVGPGNFVYRFYQFAPGVNQSLPYPSNVLTISGEEAYLIILAEQGAPGLALFLSYLALSWTDLRRRFPGDQQRDQLQGALAAGFIVACIGALFLAEQYYPPLWFLPALAASMASRPSRGQPAATAGDARPTAAVLAGAGR